MIKLAISEVSHLRHIGNVKSLTGSRESILNCFQINSVFYFGFFKQISDAFSSFFKHYPNVKSVCITNDKKSRFDTNVYFVKISNTEIVYEEETDSKLLRFVYNAEKDDIFVNKSVVYNPQTKQQFMKKLQSIGDDLATNQAFVFEA